MSKIEPTRAQRRQLARDNAKQPSELVEVPRELWPSQPAMLLRVLRSRDFLVQEYAAPEPAVVRLSVCRTQHSGERWVDGIKWDDLQRLKAEAGHANAWAVEIFPDEREVVNVANMRHLWILPRAPEYAWTWAGEK